MVGWRLAVSEDRVWKVIAAVALVALGSSLGVNGVLWWRLEHKLIEPVVTERLPLGTQVLPFEARTTSGERVQITSSETRPRILYFFSTSCGWCERNWANVSALEAATRGKYEFIGISNSLDTAEFAHERGLPFKCLTGVPADVFRRHHIGGTPRTIVLSTDGQVIGDWIGAYTSGAQKEIEGFFDIRLPGLKTGEQPPDRGLQRGVPGVSATAR
jgi:peroxiredoxin